MGKPSDLGAYNKYEVDGIDAYVKQDVQARNDELKIKHSKILFSEKLVVEGMLF